MWSRRVALRSFGQLGGLALGTLALPVSAKAPVPVVRRPFTLILDPGHGGRESGCRAGDGQFSEKNYVMSLASSLREQIRRELPSARVLLTRERDQTLSLAKRVAFANKQPGDLFLSLHANASISTDQEGFESYILPNRKVDQSLGLRAEDPKGESEEDFVSRVMIRDLRFQERRRKSAQFALEIQKQTRASFPKRVDRGVREERWGVLLGLEMPGVLHEVGFLDHADEGQFLRSQQNVSKIVSGLSRALQMYYRKIHLSSDW